MRDVLYKLFIKETNRKTQLLKNSSRALEQQRERNNGANFLLDLFMPLEYILGLQIIELTIEKTKETFQQSIMVESGIIKQGPLSIIWPILFISSNSPIWFSLVSIC